MKELSKKHPDTPTGPQPIRPFSLRELAKMYQISDKCFRTWLSPFDLELGDKKGRYFNLKQVRIIFDKLGVPAGFIDK